MLNWLKKFGLKIWHNAENHLAKCIVFAMFFAVVTIFIFFKKWLLGKHTIQLNGWLWAIISLAILLLPAIAVFLIMRLKYNKNNKETLLSDENDIKNKLREWCLRIDTDGWEKSNKRHKLINFSRKDRELGLVQGSTKRYIKKVVNEFSGWRLTNEGTNTIELHHT